MKSEREYFFFRKMKHSHQYTHTQPKIHYDSFIVSAFDDAYTIFFYVRRGKSLGKFFLK